MKKIAVNMQSRIYTESILLMLGQTGNFRPCRIPSYSEEEILIECLAEKPEILLMDVVPTPVEMSLEKRLGVARILRKELPVCGGVTIGAGSVVTHDIPAGVVVAGVPCKVIRPITEKDKISSAEILF